MIFVDLSTFFQALKCVFSRRWRSPRRILWTFLSLFAVTAVYLLNSFCRLLDELLFPGYRKVTVRRPLIITANPRSGTTFLHRLISLDRETFACFSLYQTIFPSIVMYRLFSLFGKIDGCCGRPFSKCLAWMDRRFFGGWNGMHSIGLERTEEDEALFLFNFATPALYMLFPFFREVPALRFGDLLRERKRKALARYYEASVKRFLYASGGGNRIFLAKSVLFSSRMKIITGLFPDARVVYLVRNPYEALPSTIGLFTAMWRVHSPDIPKNSEESREWARLCIDYFRYFNANRDLLGSRLMTVDYDDLKRDPAGVVKRIYRTFGIALGPAFADRLDRESARNNNFRSNHRYSLEEYGIERDWVSRELKDMFDEYGLKR